MWGLWSAASAAFPDTSGAVSTFTLWSTEVQNSSAIERADFVWSIDSDSELHRFRTLGANRTQPAVLSRYVPFGIAPNDQATNLTWWQEHHPTWLLYECDRKTPAKYWGPGLSIDFTNPEVLAWLLHGPDNSRSAAVVAAAGYDAISLDVFSTGNWARACGRYGADGSWVPLFSNSTSDAAFAAAVRAWLPAFYAGLQRLDRRLPLVINYPSHKGSAVPGYWSTDSWNSTFMLFVGNHSDGILDEEGFSGYGHGLVTGDEFLNKYLFMQNLQRHGKPYYSVNYPLGGTAPRPITADLESYVLASYLVAKGRTASVMLGNDDGFDRGRLVTPPVGRALAAAERRGALWVRTYAAAVVVVNPSASAASLQLPPGQAYREHFSGREVRGGDLSVPAHAGFVLHRTEGGASVFV